AERRRRCSPDRRQRARGLPDLRHDPSAIQGSVCRHRGLVRSVAMKRTLSDFASVCGGTLKGPDRTFTGVSSDTRSIVRGELFVPLRGPRFNANEFLAAADAAGAAGALVDSAQDGPLSQIVVADTQAALERVSHAWRHQFAIPLVGVAGSNGKTT